MTIDPSLKVEHIPVIDIALLDNQAEVNQVVDRIHQACCETGFFYIIGHGIELELQQRLEQLSR